MRFKLNRIVAVCAFLGFIGGNNVKAQLVTSNGETLVNTTVTDSTQQNCAVSMDTLGRYVVVWESEGQDGDGFGIFAKVYNADHSVRVPDFEITTTADDRVNDQRFPDVAMNAEGTFCVVWQSQEDEGYNASFGDWVHQGWDVYRRIFDIDGVAVSGRSRMNSSTAGNQMHPAVAAGDDRFVFVWASEVSGENEFEIQERYCTSAGVNLASPTVVHSSLGNNMTHPDVAMAAGGEYVFTWQVDSLDGDRNGIYMSLYDDSYSLVTGPNQVNLTTAGNQQEPRVAMDENGEFMIVWSSFDQDGDHNGIFGQRYTAAGATSGVEIAINSNTAGSQDHVAITTTREGGKYVFTWTDDSADGDRTGIYSRTMDASGSFFTVDELINTTTSDYQSFSDVAIGTNTTEAVFTWQSGTRFGATTQTDPSYYGIYSQGFIVEDVTPPVAVCQNISVYLDATGNVSINEVDVDGGSSDNVGITSMVLSNTAFSCADIGSNVVTLTVYDAVGLNDVCAAAISVFDTISPVITCVGNVSIECDQDSSPAALGSSTATDNCDLAPLIMYSDAVVAGSCPNESTINRTWTATDAQGNSSSCIQVITIEDNTLPTASNLPTINVECIGDVPAADILDVTDEADNCTVAPVVAFVSDVSDGLSCPETITRTYSVTDDCSNAITVTQTIIVNDVTLPTASNLPAINVECIGDVPAADILDVTDEADNCTVAPVVAFVSDVSDGLSCPETITRTYSVTDDCSNSITVTQSIIVNDVTLPTASNLPGINVECISDVPAADILDVTDEADNCTVAPVVAFVSDVSDGLSCPETITRTYSVTDDCSNSITVTQSIIVNDVTLPTASNLPAINVECIGDVPAADILDVTDEADNCTVAPVVAFVSDVSDGLSCPETITRTYSVTDDCSNSITVTQSIIVNDVTLPTASNLPAINVECIGDVPAADILDVTDAADNCTVAPVVAFVSDVSDGLSCPETITRTYSVTDDCSNSITVTQSIIVNDVTLPTASNLPAINVECIGDVPAADVLDVTDEADNCTVAPVVAFVSDVSDGLSCPETITRTYSVTDDCSNSIMVTQSIIVNDVTLPTASNLPGINVECIGDVPAADILDVTDEADNCTVAPVVAFVSDVSDGLSCPETITRTYSVTDDCSNSITVTQSIIVNDVTLPTASNLPAINVECIGDVPAADILDVTDEADNCTVAPVVAFVSDVSDGLSCPETITRTYSVTDDCANSITVTQLIIVNDVTAPVVDVAVLPDLTEECESTPSAPTATDNCDGIITAVSDVVFPITDLGTTVITWTFTDACGNEVTQTQNVEIVPLDVTTTLEADFVTITANNATGTYQWIDCNNGNAVIVGETNQSFTAMNNGSYAVIVTGNNCSDTSDCMTIDQVGVHELDLEELLVYPNPSSNGVFKFTSEKAVLTVQAYDMRGRIVEVKLNIEDNVINCSHLSRAKYMLEFTLEGDIVVRKQVLIVKE